MLFCQILFSQIQLEGGFLRNTFILTCVLFGLSNIKWFVKKLKFQSHFVLWLTESKNACKYRKAYLKTTLGTLLILKFSLTSLEYYVQCCIQQFFGVPDFRRAERIRKPLCSWGVWGCCKPSPVDSRGEAPEYFDYFAFWIAQNIALVALHIVELVHERSFVNF